jgi:hypothetical protein
MSLSLAVALLGATVEHLVAWNRAQQGNRKLEGF